MTSFRSAPFIDGRNPGPFEGGYRYIGNIVTARPESGSGAEGNVPS